MSIKKKTDDLTYTYKIMKCKCVFTEIGKIEKLEKKKVWIKKLSSWVLKYCANEPTKSVMYEGKRVFSLQRCYLDFKALQETNPGWNYRSFSNYKVFKRYVCLFLTKGPYIFNIWFHSREEKNVSSFYKITDNKIYDCFKYDRKNIKMYNFVIFKNWGVDKNKVLFHLKKENNN